MNFKIKKSIPLIAVFAIPVILILTVVILVSFPRMFGVPETDFLYYINSEFEIRKTSLIVEDKKAIYSVKDEKLYFDEADSLNSSQITLYYFDVKSMTHSVITVSDALNLLLDPNEKSQNGYQVKIGRKSIGTFPFNAIRNDKISTYLKNDYTGYKIDLGFSSFDSFNQYKFIGWIKE